MNVKGYYYGLSSVLLAMWVCIWCIFMHEHGLSQDGYYVTILLR